jgi:hypothetical protein
MYGHFVLLWVFENFKHDLATTTLDIHFVQRSVPRRHVARNTATKKHGWVYIINPPPHDVPDVGQRLGEGRWAAGWVVARNRKEADGVRRAACGGYVNDVKSEVITIIPSWSV